MRRLLLTWCERAVQPVWLLLTATILAGPVQADADAAIAPSVVTAVESPSLDFTRQLQPGKEAFGLSFAAGHQLNLPTGPRSGLRGGDLSLRWSRCLTPHRERALEISAIHIEGRTPTYALAGAGVQRQYFRRRPRGTAYWEFGLGLCHLRDRVPEQSTHTNFVEYVAVGRQWPASHRSAWGAEARFQHLSNAGREHPNIGLNGLGVCLTYTLYR